MTMTLDPIPEKRSARGTFWALVPVGLLAASMIGVSVLGSIAAHDPGFSLEKNYYDRAVHYGDEQAQAVEDNRLGYQLALEPSGTPSDVTLTLDVRDHSGTPLHGALVRVEAFANDRADARRELAFSELSPGRYQAKLGAARRGLWELRFTVQQGADRFTETVRSDLVSGGAGQ